MKYKYKKHIVLRKYGDNNNCGLTYSKKHNVFDIIRGS